MIPADEQSSRGSAGGQQRTPMKVALLSESPADEAALRVLVEGILGRSIDPAVAHLRARGWPSVARVLPIMIRHLHFQTETEGLVVVVDSDDSEPHGLDHERKGYFHPRCRLCQLRAIIRQTQKRFPAARGRRRILTAVGLAVPAVEAWYLCGKDPQVTENAWSDGMKRGEPPYSRKELKRRVYGTERPSLGWETRRAVEEVRRHRGDFRRLEHDFPGGFGALANDLITWRTAGALEADSSHPGQST